MVIRLVYLLSICGQLALFSDDQPTDVPPLDYRFFRQ